MDMLAARVNKASARRIGPGHATMLFSLVVSNRPGFHRYYAWARMRVPPELPSWRKYDRQHVNVGIPFRSDVGFMTFEVRRRIHLFEQRFDDRRGSHAGTGGRKCRTA